ncbi:Bacterial PH domain-containing protein [Bifidobacterium ramosum]|uniref:PH domain-containing protein n=1 Tax=Bifidobacterium ramosum TaxID=1798158 RepID=A0A6L4X0P8_9BIFI|nr:PH domain-containing protein [Bifidobacterium ramosum]KAB8287078.1 Bacterial PH domain-containing protein [Bifidobacterium ramosum]NEG71853.1 PH domain-containing protein [Bifidobacterium ramosum]
MNDPQTDTSHTGPVGPADPAESTVTVTSATPTNPTGTADTMPHAPAVWQPYPDRIQRMWLASEALQCVFWLAVCAAAAVVCRLNDWWSWQPIVIGLLAAVNVLDFASQPLQTRYKYAFHRFMIDDRFLRIRTGWLFRSTVTVPYNRVQHVDTKQGPLLRRFGLTTIVIHTAATAHEIASLDAAEAERVTALITEHVAAAKEDL